MQLKAAPVRRERMGEGHDKRILIVAVIVCLRCGRSVIYICRALVRHLTSALAAARMGKLNIKAFFIPKLWLRGDLGLRTQRYIRCGDGAARQQQQRAGIRMAQTVYYQQLHAAQTTIMTATAHA